VRTDAECVRFEPRNRDVVAGVECVAGAPEVIGSHVLLAVGRRPNTDDLAIDKAGIALDDRGYIAVDEELRTNVPGIWALGDCNGKGAFTHTAYNDFEIVAQNLLDGRERRVSDRIPCYGLFIDPPLGRVGMTEAQARAGNHKIRIGSRPMTRVARAIEKGEPQGFMKVMVDEQSHEILGAAILGKLGDRERTLDYIRRSLAIDPDDGGMLYNIACAYALLGMTEEALSSLETALDKGFGHKEWLEHDSDLDPIRATPRFQAITQAM